MTGEPIRRKHRASGARTWRQSPSSARFGGLILKAIPIPRARGADWFMGECRSEL
jgi:hypothetical protein